MARCAPVVCLALLTAACGISSEEKLSIGVRQDPLTTALTPTLPTTPDNRYVVKFKPGKHSIERGLKALSSEGGKVVLDITDRFHAVAARLAPGAAANLDRNPNIEYVEVDPRRSPSSFPPSDAKEYEDGGSPPGMPYGTQMVQADLVTADSANIDDIMVCIIDTGLKIDHSDFDSTITGYNGNLPWDVDGYGHGTHVAGTIAGALNGTGIRGVMPGARLHIVRVFGDDGSWAYSSDLADAITRCTDASSAAGTKLVVSMSLGGDKAKGRPNQTGVEEQACDDAWDAGALLVAAAGNAGKRGQGGPPINPSYPASYSSVMSVAAVDYTGTTASFSQENEFVEISAPGVAVLSTLPGSEAIVDGTSYDALWTINSAMDSANGPLADGGYCPPNTDYTDQIVLCDYYGGTGVSTWHDKFQNVQDGGGVGVILYYNEPEPVYIQLDPTSPLPGVTITETDALNLIANSLGDATTIQANTTDTWQRWNGTSMATPHVSGVAALLWSFDRRWSNQAVRDVLNAGVVDLGPSGWDSEYGYGLVQAKTSLDMIAGCVRNSFCNETCDYDPDCANPGQPDTARVKGSVSVDPSVTCGGSPSTDCNGYVAVVITEHDSSPYHLVIGDFAGVYDLSSGTYDFDFPVNLTGGPMYLWAMLFESGVTPPYFEPNDLLSDYYPISLTNAQTLVQDLPLKHRFP